MLDNILRISGVVVLLAWLPSCTSLFELPGPVPDLYNLTPKSTYPESLPEVDWQLVIEEPIASGGLDSSRIALRPSSTELKYFADSRWTERAPKMVQTLLIESFENTHKIIAVGRQSLGLRSDFNLKIEMREFQAEYFPSNEDAKVRIRINVKIVKQPRREIVASQSFEEIVSFNNDSKMHDIINAFDQATGRVFKHIVMWTLTTAH